MLQILNISDIVNENVEIDKYVPLSVVFGNEISSPIYWRVGNFKDLLLEIGVNPETGTIYSITLVSVNNINNFFKTEDKINSSNVKTGLPIFNLENWLGNKFLDEKVNFTVNLTSNNLTIKLENSFQELLYYIFSKRVIFGIDKLNNLCYIELTSLTDKEYSILKSF